MSVENAPVVIPESVAPATPPAEGTTEPKADEGTQPQETTKEGAPEGGEPAQDPPPSENVPDLFEGIQVPKDTLSKLREALGDEGAYEVAAQLDTVTELTAKLGGVPSVAELEQMAEAGQALTELYQNLETDPQKAVDFFLTTENGQLDPLGAKFVGALADGVRKGTVPRDARLAMASAVTSSILVDLQRDIAEIEPEIARAERLGYEEKAENFKAEAFLLKEVVKFLSKYAKGAPTTSQPANRDPEILRLQQERDQLLTQQQRQQEETRAQFVQDQQRYSVGVMNKVVDQYVSKLPEGLPTALRDATRLAVQTQVDAAVRAGKDPSIRLAQGKFQEGHNALAAGDTNRADAFFKQAYGLFQAGVTKLAAQVATPILNDVKLGVATKSQEIVGNKVAGEQKTGVGVGATATTQAQVPEQDLAPRPGETRSQYLERNKSLLQGLLR